MSKIARRSFLIAAAGAASIPLTGCIFGIGGHNHSSSASGGDTTAPAEPATRDVLVFAQASAVSMVALSANTTIQTQIDLAGGWYPGSHFHDSGNAIFYLPGGVLQIVRVSDGVQVNRFNVGTYHAVKKGPTGYAMGFLSNVNGMLQVSKINLSTGVATVVGSLPLLDWQTVETDFEANTGYVMFMNSVTKFRLDNAAVLGQCTADRQLQAVAGGANGAIRAMGYDAVNDRNVILDVNPSTGQTTVLSSIVFGNGGWISTSFVSDLTGGFLYALGADALLYKFDLVSGALISSTPVATDGGSVIAAMVAS